MWRGGGDICIPEDDDDSVENVESVADVVERTLGDDFEQHLNGEDGRENDVAEFDRQRQFFRLYESMKSNKKYKKKGTHRVHKRKKLNQNATGINTYINKIK